MMEHTEATETGALAGWRYVCPTCGMVISSTIETNASMDAQAHRNWHDKTGR